MLLSPYIITRPCVPSIFRAHIVNLQALGNDGTRSRKGNWLGFPGDERFRTEIATAVVQGEVEEDEIIEGGKETWRKTKVEEEMMQSILKEKETEEEEEEEG